MNREHCDLCNYEIKDNDIYGFKLYRGILSNEFLFPKHICFDCYSKIKRFVKSIEKDMEKKSNEKRND